MVFPEALNELSKLRNLMMNNVKFKSPLEGDLVFLKAVENGLAELHLDESFPKKNLPQFSTCFPMCKFNNLAILNL